MVLLMLGHTVAVKRQLSLMSLLSVVTLLESRETWSDMQLALNGAYMTQVLGTH